MGGGSDDEGLTKYGVVIDDEKTKSAGAGPESCPDCGAKLLTNRESGAPICPTCGTKPFEKQP